MATIVEPRARIQPDGAHFLFRDVSWNDYQAMLRIVGESHVRVTYDRGMMELMSPTFEHESGGYLLGRLVDALTEELDIPVEGGDTTTFQREDLTRGAEADKCYFFHEHAERIRGKKRLDLAVDPAPDLVIEVDITSSSLDKMSIYGALGISEVWRFDGQTLVFLHRQDDGRYAARDVSRGFPALRVADVATFLEQAETMDKTAWIKAFRAFARDKLPHQGPGA